jgi:hypothetical protein
MMARSKIAPLQRPDTLSQLSRSSLSELRLETRTRSRAPAAIVTGGVQLSFQGFLGGAGGG